VPARRVLRQIRDFLKQKQPIDHITFSGSGEPTLNSRLGYLITEIKRLTRIPVAVLTNGSLLCRRDVQKDLRNADIVLPTLCAATQGTFERIHRSHGTAAIRKIIAGQSAFRKVYKGRIWLEIMLIRGVNDTTGEVKALRKAVARIKPDKILLNTVVRPPSERSASPVSVSRLMKIRKFFGRKCEIIADVRRAGKSLPAANKIAAIYDLVLRRPVTRYEISKALGFDAADISKCVKILQRRGKIRSRKHGGKLFYEVK
jgi:wyosine [tRNA(Phe)-imidazoG37] synthetase (radical SAM superfamily)